jgi:tripartite-type tricarboxylate transporter receptor subunit TctC
MAMLTRTRLLLAAVLAAAALQAPAGAPAWAQSWPTKPVRLIVPAPAGVAPDIIARLLGDRISPRLGERIVVDNRPGAGGIPGMSVLVRAPADGYTLALVAASTVVLTPYLFKEPQFDVDRDLLPVAAIGTSPMMIAVGARSGIQSLGDLIARAKAKPASVTFAYPLQNSVPHLTGYMLDHAAGIELYPVVYNGSIASVTATVSGESLVTIDGLPPLVGQLKAGELKALAVTSAARLPGYEQVPAVAETFAKFESIGWFAIFAPRGTPAAVVTRLNNEVNAAIAVPDIVERLAELGVYPQAGTPEALGRFVADQRRQWKQVVDEVGLQAQ